MSRPSCFHRVDAPHDGVPGHCDRVRRILSSAGCARFRPRRLRRGLVGRGALGGPQSGAADRSRYGQTGVRGGDRGGHARADPGSGVRRAGRGGERRARFGTGERGRARRDGRGLADLRALGFPGREVERELCATGARRAPRGPAGEPGRGRAGAGGSRRRGDRGSGSGAGAERGGVDGGRSRAARGPAGARGGVGARAARPGRGLAGGSTRGVRSRRSGRPSRPGSGPPSSRPSGRPGTWMEMASCWCCSRTSWART